MVAARGRTEVPARPGEGNVTPVRMHNSSSTSPGWLEKLTPVSTPLHRSCRGAGRGRSAPAGGREDVPGHRCGAFWVPAESTPSPLPPSPPHPSHTLPPACVSPPFPSPSHPAANKMAAAWPFCFLPGRGKPGRWDLALFGRLRPCSSPSLPSLRGTGCSERGKKKDLLERDQSQRQRVGSFGVC